jgi:hypothetical protein
MPSLSQVEQWGMLLVIFLAAWVAVFKAAAGLLGALGAYWAPALKAAAFCNTAATDLHIFGEKVANLLPASTGAKMRAAARRLPPPTMLLVLIGVRWLAHVILSGALILMAACLTPAQSASDIQTTNTILNGAQQACVDSVVILPILDPSLPAATVAKVKADCPIVATVADAVIDNAITLFTEQPSVAAQAKAAAAHRRATGASR